MAGGKLTPRQKMINMMYLVLMAMLALNVSKEVLLAFGQINDSIVTTTAQLAKNSDFVFSDLSNKNQNNPEKYGEIYSNATKVKQASDKLVKELNELTADLEKRAGERNEEGRLPWENMDSGAGDEILFPPAEPGTRRGDLLEKSIAEYREFMLTMTSNKDVQEQIQKSFNTDGVQIKGGAMKTWASNKFEHYPLAAVMTFVSQLKADVRNAESAVLSKMLDEGLGEQITVNTFKALPLPISTTVMQGSSFEANVMLAAYDSTLEPEIYLWNVDMDGKRLDKSEKRLEIKNGAGVVDIPANATGEFSWGGVIKVANDEGEVSEYPFHSKYNVNQPAVVVAADKMNVLYRGVSNPISISVPGVPSNKISATGPGLSKGSNGKWLANVTNFKGREGNIVVTATMADGSKKTFPPRLYRIKDIPMPMGSVAGKSEINLPVSNLVKLPVEAKLPNFEFDLQLNVTSFSVKIEGKPTFVVNGNKMDSRVSEALKRVPIGTEVTIRDIKVSLPGNASYKIAKVSPVVVKITGR